MTQCRRPLDGIRAFASVWRVFVYLFGMIKRFLIPIVDALDCSSPNFWLKVGWRGRVEK